MGHGFVMMRKIRLALLALIVVVIVAQLVPVDTSNPPVEADLAAPPEVKGILKRACYDCHSHETVWPWYSRLAPASWLLVRDVHEGRAELNFSTWTQYSPTEQRKKLKESWKEVEEGEMPPGIYRLLHPEASLSAHDREVLQGWTLQSLDIHSR
jgi:heme-binding protein